MDDHGLVEPKAVDVVLFDEVGERWLGGRSVGAIDLEVAALLFQTGRGVELRFREGVGPGSDPHVVVGVGRVEMRDRAERLDGGAALGRELEGRVQQQLAVAEIEHGHRRREPHATMRTGMVSIQTPGTNELSCAATRPLYCARRAS